MEKKYVYSIGIFLAVLTSVFVVLPTAAQQNPPGIAHRIWGEATINGNPVSEGTVVSAVVGGEVIAKDETDQDGIYALDVPARYNTVLFRVRGINTNTTQEISSGEITRVDLNINDEEAPAIAIDSPKNGFLTGESTVTVEGSVEDDISVPEEINLTVAGEDVQLGDNGNFSAEIDLSEGSNTIEVTAEDLVGNSASESVKGTSDTQSPSLTIKSPGIVPRKRTTISGYVGDKISSIDKISVSLDGAPMTLSENGSFSEEVSLRQGTNVFTIEVVDAVGNSVSKSVEIVSDTAPPRVMISSPASGNVVGTDSVTVKGSVSDDVDDYNELSVMLNGDSVVLSTAGTFSKDITLEPGTNKIVVTAEDRGGNAGSDEITISRDDESPDIIIETPEEKLTTTKDTVTITGTIKDDVAGPMDIFASVGGVVVSVLQNGSFGKSVSLEMGVNTIVVTATDAVGNSSSETITIERVSKANWALYAGIAAIIVIVLAILAILRRRRRGSSGGGL